MPRWTLGVLAVGLTAAGPLVADQAPPPGDAPAAAASPLAPAPVIPPSAPGCGPSACATSCLLDCGPPPCGPNGRVWASVEWLYWVVQGNSLPPLVTASPPGTPRTLAGTLGTPGTTTLFGGGRANNDFRNGLRVSTGFWVDDRRTFGVEGNYFFLENSRQGFAASSPGLPILARPFVNAALGNVQASELVAFPGVLAGGVAAESFNALTGASFLFRQNLCCDCDGRVDLLYGYRYLQMTDELRVTESLVATDPAGLVPVGTSLVVRDRIRTQNTFNGAVIGVATERWFDRWYLDARATLGFGNTHRRVDVAGTTTVTPPGGAPSVRPGGLLAQGTNIGSFADDRFSFIPELGLRAGYQVTDHLRVFAGYTFLVWTDVVRTGGRTDLFVNPTQIPPGTLAGPARPAVIGRETDVWVQGISLGAELRY